MYMYVKKLNNQDPWIYYEDLKNSGYYNDCFICGNREFEGLNKDTIGFIKNELIDYSDYDVEVYYKNNLASYIIYLVRANLGVRLNLKEALKIKKLLSNEYYDIKDLISDILTVIYRKHYLNTCIRGYSQGDWQYLYYPEEKQEEVKYIEAVYFATGSEYAVMLSDKFINNADEIEDYGEDNFYTSSWRNEDIKREALKLFDYHNKVGDISNVKYFDIKDVKTITKEIVTYEEAI